MQRNRSSSLGRTISSMPLGRNRSSSVGNRTSQGSFVRRGTSSFMEQDKCAPMKDVRPLADKTFQLSCIKRLLDFLTKNGYPNVINQRMLLSPFPRDVYRIFEFIYSFVSPNFKFSSKTQAEDVIRITKFLQYPFTLRKSSLQNTGGSRHSWGEVLVMLLWLTEVAQLYRNASGENKQSYDTKFEAIGKSYQHFMATGMDCDDEELEKIFEKLVGLDETRERMLQIQDEVERAEQETNEMEMQEAHFEKEVALREQFEKQAHDIRVYVEDMKKFVPQRNAEYELMVTGHDQLRKRREMLEKEVAELKEAVKHQNEKGQSVHLIGKQRLEKVAKLRREEDNLKKIQGQYFELDVEHSRLQCQVLERFREMNSALKDAFGDVNLSPDSCYLKEFEAHLPECSVKQLEDLSAEVQAQCKHKRTDKMTLENKILKQKELVMELEHHIKEQEADRIELEKKYSEAIHKREAYSKQILSECDVIQAEIEAMENVIANARQGLPSVDNILWDISKHNKRLEELKYQVKVAEEEKNKKIKSREEEYIKSAQEFETAVQPLIDKFQKAVQAFFEEE